MKNDHLESDISVSELSCAAKLLNFYKQSIGFAKFVTGDACGWFNCISFTVNFDGYVFENILLVAINK